MQDISGLRAYQIQYNSISSVLKSDAPCKEMDLKMDIGGLIEFKLDLKKILYIKDGDTLWKTKRIIVQRISMETGSLVIIPRLGYYHMVLSSNAFPRGEMNSKL